MRPTTRLTPQEIVNLNRKAAEAADSWRNGDTPIKDYRNYSEKIWQKIEESIPFERRSDARSHFKDSLRYLTGE